MREIAGNLWDFHAQGRWVVVTTNGSVRNDGWAVMGRGVAREAAQRCPGLQSALGHALRQFGNHTWTFSEWAVLTFPVKHRWMERADLALIRRSADELVEQVDVIQRIDQVALDPSERPAVVYLVRPGCGNGGLNWAVVKPVLAPILDDRFVVVERGG